MKYLAGDPLSFKTLQRAAAHKAKACILLTNKNSSNSSEEDYKNILIALAIKKEVYVANQDQKDESKVNIPLCLQLIKPESRDLYHKSLNLSPLQDQLIIVEEIKMNLLAKSCFAPGLIALVSNLIASAGDIEPFDDSEWLRQYVTGKGHEIYRVEIDKKKYPDNLKFSLLSEISYSEYSAIVFALEIQSKLNPEKSVIRMAPAQFVFSKADDDFFDFHLYIICEDGSIAD